MCAPPTHVFWFIVAAAADGCDARCLSEQARDSWTCVRWDAVHTGVRWDAVHTGVRWDAVHTGVRWDAVHTGVRWDVVHTGVRWDVVHTRLEWLAMDCAPPHVRVPPAAAGCARLVDLLDVIHGLMCAARGCRTALAACCGFDLCHKYILYLYY